VRAALRRGGNWTFGRPDGINGPDKHIGPARNMKQFLLKFFTWWSGTTFGTNLWTSRFGELVGTDEQGNTYYRTKGGKIDPVLGFERRWVIYNGYAEASKIPTGWHGWMHHTVDVPPTDEAYTPREWQKPHQAEPDRHAERVPAGRLDAGFGPSSHRRPAITRPGRRAPNDSSVLDDRLCEPLCGARGLALFPAASSCSETGKHVRRAASDEPAL
jgi:NADH:ubiquinone oxidoreductase subunit